MEGFRRRGRQAGAAPELLGSAGTMEGAEDGARERGAEQKRGEAMPAEERLGRASPPLSGWLAAAAPEEINTSPDVVELEVDGNELCLDSPTLKGRKRRREKVLSGSRRGRKPPKQNKGFCLFF